MPHMGTSLCPGPRSTAQAQGQELTGQQQNPPELPPPQQEHLDLQCRRLLQQRMRRSVLLCNMHPTRVALMSLQQRGAGREGAASGVSHTEEACHISSSIRQLQQPSEQQHPAGLPWTRLARRGHQAGGAAALQQPEEAVEELAGQWPWAGVDSAARAANTVAGLEPGPASASGPGSSREPDANVGARLAASAQVRLALRVANKKCAATRCTDGRLAHGYTSSCGRA